MSFDLNSITSALCESGNVEESGVDFSGQSLKLDSEKDAQPIVDAINSCPNLQYMTLTGNTLGVAAAQAIGKALEKHPELKVARWSDMFTGRMKTEIPPALSALGDGMITAGARLSVLELSDNAFGPIGVKGLAKLLKSDVCSQLEELRLNNNGLGISGARILAEALSEKPPRLRVFVAGRNRLENEGATELASVFQKMESLEEVAMPQNGIYHPGITALSEAFKANPLLSSLNLNDNTIGAKGAEAVANALPSLKNLKSINFGDCLLKSRGAKALAKAFKENSVLLENLDLSHNEIGKEACMEIVDSITMLPESVERLTRVTLAGNSLGSASNKEAMKEKLGPSADLSDGEDVTDSEEGEGCSGSESESESETDADETESTGENSATEDAQHYDTVVDVSREIDTSGVLEVQSDVATFLEQPTVHNLKGLGSKAAEVIDAHLQSIKNPVDGIQAYVDAALCISGLAREDPKCEDLAREMYCVLVRRSRMQHAAQWKLIDSMLKGLALIKNENKDYKIRWHLPTCFAVLATTIEADYFPASLRDTLRFFITSKTGTLNPDVEEVIKRCPQLKNPIDS